MVVWLTAPGAPFRREVIPGQRRQVVREPHQSAGGAAQRSGLFGVRLVRGVKFREELGKYEAINFPVKMSESPGMVTSHAPLLGEHNKQVCSKKGT